MIANKWYNIAKTNTIGTYCIVNISFGSSNVVFSASVNYGVYSLNIDSCTIEDDYLLSVRLRQSGSSWYIDLYSNKDIEPIVDIIGGQYWESLNTSAGAGTIVAIINDISEDFNTQPGGGGTIPSESCPIGLDVYGQAIVKDNRALVGKKSKFDTVIIPAETPAMLSKGEWALYLNMNGIGAEVPDSDGDTPGSGGGEGIFDTDKLWEELTQANPLRVIDESHIPLLGISKINGLENKLSEFLLKAGGTITGDLTVKGRFIPNTFIVPQTANQNIENGEFALYLDKDGVGAEAPDYSYGIDEEQLWEQLGDITTKVIDEIHIPTLQISKIDKLQNILNTKVDRSVLSNYQPLITAENKLPYSLISGTPDLSLYLLKEGGVITGNLTVMGKLIPKTFVVPTSTPANLSVDEWALYLDINGVGGEGVGGSGTGSFDPLALWAELESEDPNKIIDATHIPLLEISKINGLRGLLNNKLESSDLNGYAKESWVTGQGYALDSDVKNTYATKFDLTNTNNNITTLQGYFTNGSANNALKLGGILASNFWHTGNSGSTAYNWSAKKLVSKTLVVPTAQPTDLTSSEWGIYLNESGVGASAPNGGDNINEEQLWAILENESNNIIHQSHIPTIEISGVNRLQSVLNGKVDNSALSNYLPKSGGTINVGYGSLIIEGQADDKLIFNNTDGEKYQRIVFKEANTEYGSILVRDTGVNIATPTLTVNWENVLHTGNYADTTDQRYLQLSGGAIEGTYGALNIYRNTGNHPSLVKFSNTNGVLGYLGFNADKEPVYFAENLSNYLLIHSGNIGSYAFIPRADNLISNVNADHYWINGAYLNQTGNGSGNSNFPNSYAMFLSFNNGASNYVTQFDMGRGAAYYRTKIDSWSRWYQFITDENIGSQSVNYATNAGNADTLDNNHLITQVTNWNTNVSSIFKSSENVSTNAPSDDFCYGLHLRFHRGENQYYTDLVTTLYRNELYYRRHTEGGYSDWKTIAFTDSNVASATKLQTARTIWGQSFDGTGNVSGVMTGVNTIHFGSQPYGSRGVYQGNWYAEGWTDRDIVLAFDKTHISGNVLIGATTDNGYKLDVVGNARLMSVVTEFDDEINRYGGYLYLQHRGSIVGSQGDARTSGIIMCANGGNVLIGSGNNQGPKLQISNPSSRDVLFLSSDANGGPRVFLAESSINKAAFGYDGTYKVMWFENTTAGSGLYIHDTGNVLIGTTEDKGYRLQVEGSFASYSYSDEYGTLGTRPVGASLFGPYVYGLLTWVRGDGNAYMQVGRTDNQAVAYNLVMQHLGGNVLIGTTTDNGSKLQVNGAMEATELVIPTAPPTNPQAGKHYLYLA